MPHHTACNAESEATETLHSHPFKAGCCTATVTAWPYRLDVEKCNSPLELWGELGDEEEPAFCALMFSLTVACLPAPLCMTACAAQTCGSDMPLWEACLVTTQIPAPGQGMLQGPSNGCQRGGIV